MSRAWEFLNHIIQLDGLEDIDNNEELTWEHLTWISDNNGIYFKSGLHNVGGVIRPVISEVYTPEEALENLWEKLGYE